MAWSLSDNYDSNDVEDEAGVGLIAPKSEYAARHSTEQRYSWISRSTLSAVLILSNITWAGVCVMMWRELYTPESLTRTQVSRNGFEADFGISTLNSRFDRYAIVLKYTVS